MLQWQWFIGTLESGEFTETEQVWDSKTDHTPEN